MGNEYKEHEKFKGKISSIALEDHNIQKILLKDRRYVNYHQKKPSIPENTIPLLFQLSGRFSFYYVECNVVSTLVFFLHPILQAVGRPRSSYTCCYSPPPTERAQRCGHAAAHTCSIELRIAWIVLV
jgi:hypothetical protein